MRTLEVARKNEPEGELGEPLCQAVDLRCAAIAQRSLRRLKDARGVRGSLAVTDHENPRGGAHFSAAASAAARAAAELARFCMRLAFSRAIQASRPISSSSFFVLRGVSTKAF